jgi:hypothetical protein
MPASLGSATLDQFLAASTTKVPGTRSVSLTDDKARTDVIAYRHMGAAASAASAATTKPAAPLGRARPTMNSPAPPADKQNWLYLSKITLVSATSI